MAKKAKYKTLKALAEALRSGKEPEAHCTYDKEFVAVTTRYSAYPGECGTLLFECADDHTFVDEALRALGIEMGG